MKNRLARVKSRRLELLTQIAAQRTEMAEISQHLKKPFAVADAGLKAVHLIFSHPVLLAGGVTALLALRRKGSVGLIMTGWRLLRLYPSAIFSGLKYLLSATRSTSGACDTEA